MKLKKLLFLMLFALLAIPVTWAQESTESNIYVKVTDASQLKARKKYILAHVYDDRKVSVAGAFSTSGLTSKYKSYSQEEEFSPDMNINLSDFSGASVFTFGKIESEDGTKWTIKLGDNFIGWVKGSTSMAQLADEEDQCAQWSIESDDVGFYLINKENKLIRQNQFQQAFKPNTRTTNKAYLYLQESGDSPTAELIPSTDHLILESGSSGTFTVSGNNLPGDISVSVTTEGFRVDPATIAVTDGSVTNAVITVTYNGPVEDIVEGSIILSSGSGTDKIEVSVPVTWKSELIPSTDHLIIHSGSSGTFTVSGNNLLGDISVSVTPESFSVDPVTIAVTDGSVTNAVITVTYDGPVEDIVEGSITLSSGRSGTDKIEVSFPVTWVYDNHSTMFVKVTDASQIQPGKKYILANVHDPEINPNPNLDGKTAALAGQLTDQFAYVGLERDNFTNYYSEEDNIVDITNFGTVSKLILGTTGGYYTFQVNGKYIAAPSDVSTNTNTSKIEQSEVLNDFTQWNIVESDNGFYLTSASNNICAILQSYGLTNNYSGTFQLRAYAEGKDALGYLYVQSTVPDITPSSKLLDIVDGMSTSFTVSGNNLTEDIQVSLRNGSNDGFSVTPSSIAVTNREVSNAPVIVTYNGRNNSNATALIELKSGSATEEVTVRYIAQNLFTEAGNYYVKNNGNSKYVVIDAENYNATASADTQLDANVVTLAFDDNGIVTTMNDLYGDGDLIAILEQVKTVLKNRLNSQGLNSDFVDDMFKIKLVRTGNGENSVYFCFDIPAIENVDAVRNYLLSEANLPDLVTGYLDLLLQPYKRIYLNVADANGTFGFTDDKSVAANKWLVEEYVIPEDDLFTTAGDYYVSNKGNNKYVVIDAENYNATASAGNQQDADIITLGFDGNGIVTTMRQLDGEGEGSDLIAVLEHVKTVLKNRLDNQGLNSDFVEDMFKIKLVKTGDADGSMYFCFDIPKISTINAVRNFLLNEANLPAIVTGYLDVLLQPGKRIYLNATGDNGTFGFTKDNTPAATKWLVEEYVEPVDDLFTTAGDYYVSNKGNSKYVIIDADNYNATASVGKDDANVITLAFDDNGIVTTMKQLDGEGEGSDLIAVLEHVKTVLKNRLDNQGLNSDFLEDMFKIKLVKTGDSDGSMYFCFDIPKISSINAVRNFLLNEANLPAIVTGYLDVLLQPGKRVYLNATGDNGIFGFTRDKDAASSKWMVEEYVEPVDDLFTEAGNYYVSNKGNSKYVIIDADNYNATASVGKDDANVITLAFDDNGIVTTMEDLYGDGDMIAILEQVKTELRNRLPADINTDFLDEMFKIKLIKTGDEDGSIHFCFVIPKPINDLDRILEVVNNINNDRVKDYLNKLLQPGKHVYLCTADENGSFDFTQDNRLDAAKWMVEAYVTPEDDLFTTAGDYYVSNKGNNNYVVIDAENYNATASAGSQQDADIITLDFDGDGIVTTMKQKDGEGEGSDLIAVLEHVKTVLKNKLAQANLDGSFVDDMFKIKLVETGDEDGSIYFCFDIPKISKLSQVRECLGSINNERVVGYLDVLLQPGKRIYLNAIGDNGIFGFTREKDAASSKWMVEQAEVVEDELFTEAGEYLVSNKGNSKYVVIDAENYNATASVENQDDADVIAIDFDENGIVTTMKRVDGNGDMLAILYQVKSELRNRIPDDINTDFLDEMFKIKLVKTGDEDGSIYFCFDIPQIDRLDEILAVVNNINNDRVKDYLNKLLQPGKRIYLCVDDLEQGTFNFTQDKRLDAAKWMVKSVKQTDRWTVIYFDMETANQYDYYFQAWDETDGEDNPYNYFENKPGVKVTSLPTTNIGETKTVYEFSYRYKSKEPRLILTMGEGQHKTAEITPKNHEIFYYYGGGEYVYNDGEPRTEPSYTIGIPVDEVIFPDEGFRTYMGSTKFGKSVDGSFKSYDNSPSNKVLEPWEIENADVLTATTMANVTIKDLTGIEYLTSLKEISLTGGRLSETSYLTLDFETLDLTMLKNNSLEKISVSHADKMTTFELPEGHPLKSLSLSSCNAMQVGTLNDAETLEELRLQNCSNFAELNITKNNKLKILEISSVPITSLDLNGKNDLEVLSLSLTNITNDINEQIADKSKLRELSLYSNEKMQGTVLNIANKPDIDSLRVFNQDNYGSITLDNAVSKLKYMDIQYNDNLTTLTLPALTAMEDMWIRSNPALQGCTVDLTGNTSLKQININSNAGASTIKGMGSQMTDLRYVKTEHQLYDGNVLDLSNCANLHQLDVIHCNLDRISVDGCTALGTKIPGNQNDMTLLVYGNHLRALDLEEVTLPYNFNVSPGADGLNGINKYFMSGDYVYHAGYNSQSVPTIKPRVGYVFHEYYNQGEGTNSYTYMVYVSLASGGAVSEQDTDQSGDAVLSLNDLFRNWRAKGMADELPQSEYNGQTDEVLVEQLAEKVADSGFDHNRVKLWKRFSENHPNTITIEARHGKGDELVYVHGTKGATTNSVRPRGAHEDPENWEIDPAEVKGDILVLGVYTVPVGVNKAEVSGKVSYLYGTRSDDADPEVENGDFVTESEEINFYKDKTLTGYNTAANTATGVNSDYDNTFPVEFKWVVTLTDKPDEIITNIEDLNLDLNREVAKVSYVNMMGVESDRPFEGVNIVVTRYTDGSVTTTKVIK